jgi:hypothetical protein
MHPLFYFLRQITLNLQVSQWFSLVVFRAGEMLPERRPSETSSTFSEMISFISRQPSSV